MAQDINATRISKGVLVATFREGISGIGEIHEIYRELERTQCQKSTVPCNYDDTF